MKTITIKDWPGPVGELQVHHNLPASPSNYNACLARNVGDIVMHYTGNKQDTARGNANYFHTGSRGASAHFFVDETSIWQSVGLRDMAWHFSADKYKHPTARNYNTIGIEMCTSGGYRVSEKTKENGAQLCAEMCKLLNIGPSEVDKHVHRHWDMTGKNCPAQMAGEGNQEWAQFKARVKQILEGDDEMLSYEDFKKYMERYTAEQAKKPIAPWAEKQIEQVEAAGVMTRDSKGNFRRQSFITRQEVAVITAGVLKKANK